MEEPKHMTVQQLKKKLGKYPDHMPVVGIDNEFITTTEHDTIALEDGFRRIMFNCKRCEKVT